MKSPKSPKVKYMNKDQTIGTVIFLACIAIAASYLLVLFAPQLLITAIGLSIPPQTLQFWTVATVVLIAFLAIMFIGAWIGWTMATTPPPKTIEELEADTSKSTETDEIWKLTQN
jgi:predicted DNA-binding transcriptional regulator